MYFYNIPTQVEERGDDLEEVILSLNPAGETYSDILEWCQTNDFRVLMCLVYFNMAETLYSNKSHKSCN